MTWKIFGLRLWLNRRRSFVFVSVVVIAAALWLSLLRPDGKLAPDEVMPGILLRSAGLAMGIGLLASCLAAVVPAIRWIPDVLSVMTVGLLPVAVLDNYWLLPDSLLFKAILWSILYGTLLWIAITPGRGRGAGPQVTVLARANSRLERDRLWPWLAPTPDCNVGALSRRIGEFKWIEPGRSFSYLSAANIHARMEAEIESLDRPDQVIIRWRASPEIAQKLLNPEGRLTTSLTDRAIGCQVEQSYEFPALSLRMRALAWLDDSFTRNLVEGIYETESCKEP
ncbi:hypothetical protein HOY34_10330 [Xinfangfangia sp. D13-10-4-6]|uniref:hypothetical protein n=1 Tax=Pseudogemmobacter hezensis TaxID=2737662 RepID=UPI0015534920|nr:hypothetical protein [Pseudogemmobacter hezensis]NPD15597.1 hypothetical protein [Pseudogemmobacter hezensis]